MQFGRAAPRFVARKPVWLTWWYPGTMTVSNVVVARFNIPDDCLLPAGLPKFACSGTANATGSPVFNIASAVLGQLGTITVNAGTGNGRGIGVVSFAQNAHLPAGDLLTITLSGAADTTLADFSGSMIAIAKIAPGV
jgi:hypothetical protein